MGNPRRSAPLPFDSLSRLLKDLEDLKKRSGLGVAAIAEHSRTRAADPARLPAMRSFSKSTVSRLLNGEAHSDEHFTLFIAICVEQTRRTGTALPPSWDDLTWWRRRWAAVGPDSALDLESQDATWEGDASGALYAFSGLPPTELWGAVDSHIHRTVHRMRAEGRADNPEEALRLARDLQRLCGEGPAYWAASAAVAYWTGEAGGLRQARDHTKALLREAQAKLGAAEPFTLLTARRLADREADLGNHRRALGIYERLLIGRPRQDEAGRDQLLTRLGRIRSLAERGDLFTAHDDLSRRIPVVRTVFGPRHPVHLRARAELLRLRTLLAGAAQPPVEEYEKLLAAYETAFGDRHRYTLHLRGVVAECVAHAAVAKGRGEEVRKQRERVLTLWEERGRRHRGHPVTLGLALLAVQLSLCDQELLRTDLERRQARTQASALCEEILAACADHRADLGTHHPYEATALSVLGALELEYDRPAAARNLERAVVLFRRTLGPEHPDAAAALSALLPLLPDGERPALGARLLAEESGESKRAQEPWEWPD